MVKSINLERKAARAKLSGKPTGDVGPIIAKAYAEAASAGEKALRGKTSKKVEKRPKPVTNYRLALITFIDILGFSNLVATSNDPGRIRDILNRLASFAANKTDAKYEIDETAAVVFSDSIVRVRFLDGPYRSGALFQEVLKLLHIQGEMLADDVLLRGGLTVGLIHVEGQMAFGPGFIRAYKLESEFANYPRIVIGPEVFKTLRDDKVLIASHHDLEDEVHYQKQMLKRGEDGLWFIDYLYGFEDEMDDPGEHVELAEQHRALVIKSANAAKPDSRVLQKHLWLARYVNDVAERLNRPELTITQVDVPALEELAEEPIWAMPPKNPKKTGGGRLSEGNG